MIKTMFDACGTITEALRTELVTVAEEQARLEIPGGGGRAWRYREGGNTLVTVAGEQARKRRAIPGGGKGDRAVDTRRGEPAGDWGVEKRRANTGRG